MPDLLPLLVSTDGVASRRDFWIAAAVLLIAGIVFGLLPIIGALASLALLYPWTCLSMQRLRDMGRSPRLALIPLSFCCISGLLGLVTLMGAGNPAMLAATVMLAGVTLLVSSIAMLVAVAFLLWIGLSTGSSDTQPPRSSHVGR